MNEKHRFSRFPKTLGDCIEPVIRPALKDKGLAGSKILTDWQKIIGEPLASRCVPQKLSFPRGKTTGGTLTIAVENGFATEFQYMQPVILERLAIYFGYKAIDRITINHTLPPKIARKKSAPSSVIPASADHLLDEVEDAELKEALKAFTQAGSVTAV